MGRTVVRPLERQRNRRSRDRLLVVVVALVVAFALIGVGSAGAYVAGKFSSTSKPTATAVTTANNTASAAALAHARSEATAIVKAAQDASGSIVNSANKRARQRAAGIIAAAHHQAHVIVAAARQQPTAVALVAPTTSTSGAILQPTAIAVYPAAGQTITVPGTQPATVPNLSGVPASWQVVGYNVTFGTGSGSAGSISVINRGSRSFSGVAVVRYTKGGSATAPFSGLAPGQAVVLPLNGSQYSGGGYRIILRGLH